MASDIQNQQLIFALIEIRLRTLLAIFLSTLLSMPWLTKLAITADFFAHQDYIAANLCENRDKPELHCDGKCVLMQKLNMVEESDSQQKPIPEILGFEFSNFLQTDHDTAVTWPTNSLVKSFSSYLEILPNSVFPGDIFHPPRVLA